MAWILTFKPNDGGEHVMAPPFEGADHALVTGWRCACGASKVQGKGPAIDGDTITSRAVCVGCGVTAGHMVARTTSTIFGLDEDQRVLNGRCRVY